MLRISKLSDYAVVVLSELVQQEQGAYSSSILAQSTKLPEPTVSKVLKLLTKADIVKSTRGIRGGYSLTKKPADITIEQIITSIDGPVSITACSNGSAPDCSVSETCSVRGRWDDVNTAIKDALNAVTLADMAQKEIRKAG